MQIFLDFSCKNIIFAADYAGNSHPQLYYPMNKFEKTLSFIRQSIKPDSPFYGKIYLVGGCVRDELLGERYSDLDLLVDLPSGQKAFVEHMCEAHPDVCKGPFYYQRYGTTAMDVIIDGSLTLVECVEPHVEEYAEDGVTLLDTRFCTLEEDSSRRDYTCNALYKNLHTLEVLDPTGRGIADLKAGLLVTPSEPGMIYRQDPVRMLRGIRFKHQKGFRLDPVCWQAIVDNADAMANAAPKRMRDELNKMLKSRTFGEGIHNLYVSGLLKYVMPGLDELLADDAVLPNCEEGVTLWNHTRRALYVQGREHPRTDTIYKLSCLVCDIAQRHGREVAAQILLTAGIGHEKVSSIVHICDLYRRFTGMFRQGTYVATPRVLPHFIVGLAKHRDNFRRLVRALNTGLRPEEQLPWRVFYDDGEGPKPREQRTPRSRRRRSDDASAKGTSGDAPTGAADPAASTTSARKHKRNVKRREQRKRARRRQSSDAPAAE